MFIAPLLSRFNYFKESPDFRLFLHFYLFPLNVQKSIKVS